MSLLCLLPWIEHFCESGVLLGLDAGFDCDDGRIVTASQWLVPLAPLVWPNETIGALVAGVGGLVGSLVGNLVGKRVGEGVVIGRCVGEGVGYGVGAGVAKVGVRVGEGVGARVGV